MGCVGRGGVTSWLCELRSDWSSTRCWSPIAAPLHHPHCVSASAQLCWKPSHRHGLWMLMMGAEHLEAAGPGPPCFVGWQGWERGLAEAA